MPNVIFLLSWLKLKFGRPACNGNLGGTQTSSVLTGAADERR